MRMRGSIAFALILSSCSQYDAVGSEDRAAAGGDASTVPPVTGIPERSVMLELASDGYVIQGTISNVVVNVRRELFDAPLRITLTGLPAGATATEVLIPAGATKATVAVAIPATTPQGRTNVFLQAKTVDDFTATNAAELYVRGRAGTIDPRFANSGFYDFAQDLSGSGLPLLAVVGERMFVAFGDPTFEIVGFASKERFATDFAVGKGIARVSIPDAKALVAAADGSVFVAAAGPSRFARVLANGTLDSAFDPSAMLTKVPSDFSPIAGTVQPDGKVVFVGRQSTLVWGATRFSATGALDPTFAAGGYFTSGSWARDPGDIVMPSGVRVRPTGQILVGGTVRSGDYATLNSRDFYAASQLTSTGTLDSTFGSGGTMRLFPDVEARNQGLSSRPPALRSDGTFVLFGNTWSPPGMATVAVSPAGIPALARLASAASTSGSTQAADGSILYSQSTRTGALGYTTVRKLRPDGTPDGEFGDDGVVSLARPPQVIGYGIEHLEIIGPYLYVVFSWAPDGNTRERRSVTRIWN